MITGLLQVRLLCQTCVDTFWALTPPHVLSTDERLHESAGDDDDRKLALMEQLKQLNASYPGGLKAYITNAKRLLEGSKAGRLAYHQTRAGHRYCSSGCATRALQICCLAPLLGRKSLHVYAGNNAFEGYVPSVPEGEKLDFGSREFRELEEIGAYGVAQASELISSYMP